MRDSSDQQRDRRERGAQTRVGDTVARESATSGGLKTIIACVAYVRDVRYICADRDMINIRYLASMPDDTINPYADEPLYVQLAGIVRRMIDSGTLRHLDPVPSESSLVQTYGVSRDTVRRTIALLREEGVVFTVPHRGTYVGPRPG